MRNVDLTNVGHDEVLFQRVRTAYDEMRGTRNRKPFTVPKTIQYVKFELMFRHKSRECVGNIEVDSIPSIKEVYNGEYAYRPCPPDIGKYPVHPQVFMHSFFEPGDHTGSAVINRLLKKLYGEAKLRSGPRISAPASSISFAAHALRTLNRRSASGSRVHAARLSSR
ncbi:hypothetical protein QBC33DRAFT_593195 [Phialemonium atrogriseum]|uniref:Uncharacterized protein n=1 Tax=Phialemonium atrogriseum TaxID=1093897 RepID=A0AAJ0BVE2_9PEZI|nr:uncharacterized protein QBC33DRAFT_593195 [Phialemonium atrogriseum]KAK1765189.1 hypothetical protein QBC33DRAFT_593195 [Phialemonium atrogriseum]